MALIIDMLNNGIYIRDIVNLAFTKQVYFYTKFCQMIGHRTRLLEDKKYKPWCPGKDVFLIMDY